MAWQTASVPPAWKKGCVNLSLMDSGAKRRRLFRLCALALTLLLCASFGAVVTVAEDAASVDASEAVETASGDTFASGFANLSPDATLGEKLVYGLKVAGIGLIVVFLVLIIIMAILYVFKLVAVSKGKSGSSAPSAVPSAAPAAAAPAAPPAAPAAPVAPTADAEEERIVAIATAAIAASRGASDCAFRVISVTKLQ